MTALELPDPRRWPRVAAQPAAAALHDLATARLAASASHAADALDARIDTVLERWLREGDGARLAHAIASAPSAAVARHLWRRLALAEAASLRTAAMAAVMFAFPVVVVAARATAGTEPVVVPAVLRQPQALSALLGEQGAIGASQALALAASLVGAPALDLDALPALLAHARAMLDGGAARPLDLPPAPIFVPDAQERAHLRFVVGTLLTGPQADPLRDAAAGPWALAATRWLSAALATPGATVLALPRPPQPLTAALASGRAAQREVALQLFVGAALRDFRARVGEPVAVLSAHGLDDGEGELRLSLSSPLDERGPQDFRYPLARYERVPDAVAAIAALLADCRVLDVRTRR